MKLFSRLSNTSWGWLSVFAFLDSSNVVDLLQKGFGVISLS